MKNIKKVTYMKKTNLIAIIILLALYSTAQADAIIIGGISKHHGYVTEQDEVNPLIGYEWGNYQCGAYDNSRMKISYSYYCGRLLFQKNIFRVSAGASLYDGMSGYSAKLKPFFGVGLRFRLPANKVFLDVSQYYKITFLTVGFTID